MFRTTLVNLDADLAHASWESGKRSLGELTSDEVVSLLDRFCLLDPAENAKAEPEIHFEVRRNKYLVRTGMGQLHVYDPRRPLEPALVLTTFELIAEMDGTAAAGRARPPFPGPWIEPEEPMAVASAPKPVAALRPPHRLALSAAALLFSGYLAYAAQSAALPGPKEVFEPITDDQEAQSLREDLAGVYMTGSQPGQHGIALTADGTMKLFQLNAQGTPSLLQDTFQIGRVDGKASALGRHAGEAGAMRRMEAGTLTYCGELYRKVP